MIKLFEASRVELGRQSSKGNQLKWRADGIWYKADYLGYEGLAEYIVSGLLQYTDMRREEFICYDTEQIVYKRASYCGCKSTDFLDRGWQLITLERLYKNAYNRSLYRDMYALDTPEKRLEYLVKRVRSLTGLTGFDSYMSKLLTIDAFFLNEDRHMHNIAVLIDPQGKYHYCPYFDHGGALLSDMATDYPEEGDIVEMIDEVQAKTISMDFDEQLEAAERLYGQQIEFRFKETDLDRLLQTEPFYSAKTKERVKEIVMLQKSKYSYLFFENS